MKKIAIVNAEATIGGVESALVNMLQSFDYTQYDVTLYTDVQNNPYAIDLPQELRQKIKVVDTSEYTLRKRALRYLTSGAFLRLIRLCFAYLKAKRLDDEARQLELVSKGFPISDERYDCAIAYKMGFRSTAFALFLLLSDIKVYWVHGMLTGAPGCNPIYKKWIESFDHLFAVSQSVIPMTLKEVPAAEDKIEVFLNIVDANAIRQKAALGLEEAKAEMNDEESMKLLTVSRFNVKKNVRGIPYLCRRLRDKGIRFHWYIIGYGSDEALIRGEIDRYSVGDCCTILGLKENPYPYLSECDVYIHPSWEEGRSVAVVEAQVLGKSVIITNYESAQSQLEDGVDGFIVPREADACADAIAQLLNNKPLLRQAAENTRAFDYENKKEMQKLYRLIAQSR